MTVIKDLHSAVVAKLWFRRGIRRMILAVYPGIDLPKIFVQNCEVDTDKGILTIQFRPIPGDIFNGS